MHRICAWCGCSLEDALGASQQVGPITHGICQPCLLSMLSNNGTPLRLFLDHLELPVAVVDGEGRVQTANTLAVQLLGKTATGMHGQPGWVVFDCAHSQLPGGCGNTDRCSGCVIRSTVLDTMATGQPHVRVPATLKQVQRSGTTIPLDMLTPLRR